MKRLWICMGIARECRYFDGDGNGMVGEKLACKSDIVEVLPFFS